MSRKITYHIIVLIYFLSIFYHYFIENIIGVVFIAGMLSSITIIGKRLTSFYKLALLSLTFIVLWSLLLGALKGYYTSTPLLLFPSFAIANIIYERKLYKNYFLLIYYFYLLMVTYKYVFVSGLNMNYILSQSSRNYVAATGLVILATHYIYSYYTTKKVNIIHAIPLFIIALLAIGRASILSSALLIIVLLLHRLNKTRVIFLSAAILISSLVFQEQIIDYYYSTEAYENFQDKGLESSGREILNLGYLERIDFITFLTGVPLNQFPFNIYGFNIHNSILNGHALFGVLFFFIFYVLYLGLKRAPFITIIFSVVFIRSLTDTLLFVGVFDYLWILVLLIILSKSRSAKQLTQSNEE